MKPGCDLASVPLFTFYSFLGKLTKFVDTTYLIEMISEIKDNKVHLVFNIGEYDQELIDFLTLLDTTSKSRATDKDIEELSEEINRNW